MSPVKATLLIIAAFLIGAIAPLLGLLAAVFGLGALWAGSRTTMPPTKCDPQLMREVQQWTRDEQRKLEDRR